MSAPFNIISLFSFFISEIYCLLFPVTIPSAKSALSSRYAEFGMLLILHRTLYSASDVVKLKYSALTVRSMLMVNEAVPVLTFIPTVERGERVHCKSSIIHGH